MSHIEKWIWISAEKYPALQRTDYNALGDHQQGTFAVAEFKKKYIFKKTISSVHLRFSGDTEFVLYCNDKMLATGPAAVGGDFLFNEKVRPNFYATQLQFCPDSNELNFFARVKLMPVVICEYSKGHGGFMLTAEISFSDGTKTVVSTDKTWQSRKNGAYYAPSCYDGRIAPDAYIDADEIENIWHTTTAPIPVRTEVEIYSGEEKMILLEPHEEKEVVLPFDRIYAGFVHAAAKTDGMLYAKVFCRELEEEGTSETLVFDKDGTYRGFQLHSAGNFLVKLKNDSDAASAVSFNLISTFYPIDLTAKTVTSDTALNAVLDVCAHTLKYCRQTHHLDSARHCEPLACTGDYYIESLMTAFSYGDMALAKFDITRTAELLRNHDGRMFHTTYSLIWVLMLYDVYQITGDIQLLYDCEDALILLMERFETYLGENGLIETPPDYMFVDWIVMGGYSLHHPPKALGQTCLNMYYFGALDTAAKIYNIISETPMADTCICKKEKLKEAINDLLFDVKKGLYIGGLNTETPEQLICHYMPQNSAEIYYFKQPNILAAYFGVCDKSTTQEIIHKIMSDECPGEYQPYFAHFMLEAIYKNGLRNEYTLKVLEMWKQSVATCPKGLVEGFIPPEEGYQFDHSHAWGGTPLYSLPKALMGLEIVAPGLKELTLSPSLLGLKEAKAALPTPYGFVTCEMHANEEPVVTYPKEITVRVNKQG